MRLAIDESTGQDKHKNRMIAIISYNQSTISLFKKNIR